MKPQKATPYLNLVSTPTLVQECSACGLEVDSTGDEWLCPSCGTTWNYSDQDGTQGTLYRDETGELPGGPTVTEDEAWQIAHLHEPARSRQLTEIRNH